MDNEEYDEEYRLDDNMDTPLPPWYDFSGYIPTTLYDSFYRIGRKSSSDNIISGYDYIFLRQNGLTWEDRIK